MLWPLMESLSRFFEIRERGSTIPREFRGAVATFLTTAYILFVNPLILNNNGQGVPLDTATIATAAAAGICCTLMGVVANFPLALASGMGLNAIVAYQVATVAGSWQAAMGLVVLDGLLTAVLVLAGLREAIMNAIPRDLRLATGAGIGLFIAFIGLVQARIVIVPPGTLFVLGHHPGATMPPVGPGSFRDPSTALALAGLVITACLIARRITGALIIGIVSTTILAFAFRVQHLPQHWAWPDLRQLRFVADVRGALHWNLMPLLFAIIMADFFDTLGTATAVAEEAGLADERGRIPKIRRVLLVDSISAAIGGALGASSVTSYIESAAGVAEGARTGLHSVFVGVFFLIAIFASPLAGIIPQYATAPALIIVGFLMISQMAKIDFGALDTAIPAFITLIAIPLTYPIAHGIGYGFITFSVIKLLSGRGRDVHLLMYFTSAAFLAYFVWGQ
jgi:AGZA family xanthine/uracil permease-like MFS transporter